LKKFPRIDVHTHILPEQIPDLAARYGYGSWIRLEHQDCGCKAKMFQGDSFFREIDANCYRPSARLPEMDQHNVAVQALSTVPVMFSYWAKPQDCLDLSRLLNDHIAACCARDPERFVGLATIPMQDTELAIEELRRVMSMGFVGIQIGTHVNDMPLSHESLFPIFAECAALGACVFVHPWDMQGAKLMQKYWLPWLVGMPAETSFAICSCIFSGLIEKLPSLRLCFAHGGGSFPGTIGRIEHGFECRPDLVAMDNPKPPREYCGRFWVDSLTHEQKALLEIVSLFGADRIVLGSDYPFPLGEAEPGRIVESAPLDQETKQRILWDNAIAFLGLEKQSDKLWQAALDRLNKQPAINL